MVSTSEIELLNYFVFNPKFGQKEGEEEKKILYYYPHDTNKDLQLKNAGLCEALVKFTESFNTDRPCHNIHTEKTKQFLYQPESDFWTVMTVAVPVVSKTGNGPSVEYNSVVVSDNVYEAVLRKSYKMYKIFCNSFKSSLSSLKEEMLGVLKEKLKNFYDNYLSNLKLAHCDILDVYQGISFLPLGKEPFLHVQSFINLVETKFKPVKYSAFLYNDQLVWSGILSSDMQMIYQYLVFSLLPSHLDLELQGGSLPRGSNSSVHHYGSFVTGPSNLKDSIVSTGKGLTKCLPLKRVETEKKTSKLWELLFSLKLYEVVGVPKVYLTGNDEEVEIFHLVVYRALSATLCLFIPEDESLSLELFKSLDSFLGPQLTTLVSEVSEHCARFTSVSTSNEGGPKVLYFNKLNLAQKTTMHIQNRKNVSNSVPVDLLRIISELNGEKSRLNECGEIMMLTLNDCWLVGRFSNSREFYVIFTQKKGTLLDVTEEVKRLSEAQLKGIFFTD